MPVAIYSDYLTQTETYKNQSTAKVSLPKKSKPELCSICNKIAKIELINIKMKRNSNLLRMTSFWIVITFAYMNSK